MYDYNSRTAARPRSVSHRKAQCHPDEYLEVPGASYKNSPNRQRSASRKIEIEMHELDCSFKYEDCDDCGKEQDLADLQEAFSLGANGLRASFDEAMKRLTAVFNQKFDNYKRQREKLEKNRVDGVAHFKNIHTRLKHYRNDIISKGR